MEKEKKENLTPLKCVLVIEHSLPIGLAANTAAVLSLSVGKRFPHLIGRDLEDKSGVRRAGITTAPIPILSGESEWLRNSREAMKSHEPELSVFELISATRVTKSYEEYATKMRDTPIHELEYFGLALCGPVKLVNKFTGSLPLFR